ncbi:unnamed protein product [Phaeothamnion confervicola]
MVASAGGVPNNTSRAAVADGGAAVPYAAPPLPACCASRQRPPPSTGPMWCARKRASPSECGRHDTAAVPPLLPHLMRRWHRRVLCMPAAKAAAAAAARFHPLLDLRHGRRRVWRDRCRWRRAVEELMVGGCIRLLPEACQFSFFRRFLFVGLAGFGLTI